MNKERSFYFGKVASSASPPDYVLVDEFPCIVTGVEHPDTADSIVTSLSALLKRSMITPFQRGGAKPVRRSKETDSGSLRIPLGLVNRFQDMSRGRILDIQNTELGERIEGLRRKRDSIQEAIIQQEEEKNKLQHDIRILADRLAQINEILCQKIMLRDSYDRLINESEFAYVKIIQSSYALLASLRSKDEKSPNTSGRTRC
ncbi:hypothetical protein T265_03767 [Opisthorchis viverrini]|uniref:Uncharacterized protein n=1 Tax=Opisthorchis viverrini TaxID=6198 RepID=A0A075A2D4_OPIVI|nr:hypothetical protein T265_03767 [Opisthorchis viverrini]KER29660.1 hypothetical protein T265_03767 [Opisthorchis viverrini]